jgi:glycosyltransferase involved in cell wall biosynthesis
MVKISAVINTRNEEQNIRYCLETLNWCDEIIIVDMESEDKTVEIAREYTDKIYCHEKVLAFDLARQFAVDHATGEWVLLIDADEMIPCTLADTLTAISVENNFDIVEVPFKHYIMGDWIRHSGWGYTPMPRFFRRGKINFGEKIHGYMDKVADARIFPLVLKEENCIVHFNYIDSAHFVEKLNRYTNIEAQLLFNNGEQFSSVKLFISACREFYNRFVKRNGYRDGVRGFALCLMMSFYRTLAYIKLWEMHQCKEEGVSAKYDRIRLTILTDMKVKR